MFLPCAQFGIVSKWYVDKNLSNEQGNRTKDFFEKQKYLQIYISMFLAWTKIQPNHICMDHLHILEKLNQLR